MTSSFVPRSPELILEDLVSLRDQIIEDSEIMLAHWAPTFHQRAYLLSVRNFAHYLALRRRDHRPIQRQLTVYGLSSLGRSEARVMPTLNAVIATLGRIAGLKDPPPYPKPREMFRGERLLEQHTNTVFGSPPQNRRIRVMVTLPTEAAEDGILVTSLVARGMDCARINCSHDAPDIWLAMIEKVKIASDAANRPVKILMDLAGPKPRTLDIITPKKTRLNKGDAILLTRDIPEKSAAYPFQARCSLPEVLDQLIPGRRVFLDDGQVAALVEDVHASGVVLRITHTRQEGYKLKNEKGLNFPDTELRLSPLQPADLETLDFVAGHADMIGYSFVQSADDIALLQRELAARIQDGHMPALIAKIETPLAVRNLPEIIVQAVGEQPFGVMIARGDLAVEIGFERTAEMQEEIMWLCEAAHVPVIWATQVMESFMKSGTPSRGEMTDAAMSSRAECVMLNKGPYVLEAVTMMDALLSRMQEHQTKKTPQLRALRSWDRSQSR